MENNGRTRNLLGTASYETRINQDDEGGWLWNHPCPSNLVSGDDIENPAEAGWLDSLYQYYGIEEFSGSAKVTLAVE